MNVIMYHDPEVSSFQSFESSALGWALRYSVAGAKRPVSNYLSDLDIDIRHPAFDGLGGFVLSCFIRALPPSVQVEPMCSRWVCYRHLSGVIIDVRRDIGLEEKLETTTTYKKTPTHFHCQCQTVCPWVNFTYEDLVAALLQRRKHPLLAISPDITSSLAVNRHQNSLVTVWHSSMWPLFPPMTEYERRGGDNLRRYIRSPTACWKLHSFFHLCLCLLDVGGLSPLLTLFSPGLLSNDSISLLCSESLAVPSSTTLPCF